ncbi:hypothetical protein EPIR_1942 [Erwinia piriflorinigrans CFBP 5888]|uniref:Uncharacterized protein n=1 Tax=Erwinia piriflorinigrans CFBP 5888 TaxID=1161919 RepID=V5Z7J1_9GAMM|nr:hypothetical protein EPIR_1942 [Erwinia piriflorinigrans CFBP 5888]
MTMSETKRSGRVGEVYIRRNATIDLFCPQLILRIAHNQN